MRTLILLISAAAIAADRKPDPGPRPIPPEKQENISRAMLRAAFATINLLSLREQPTVNMDQLRKVEQERAAANSALQSLMSAYQAEFNAAGCTLSVEKRWECPKETSNATDNSRNQR